MGTWRLEQVKLALDHTEADLRGAALARLGVEPQHLLALTVARRGYDARKRGRIALVYTLDAELAEGAPRPPGVAPAPDLAYRPVAAAPDDLATRPVVIGAGPCGLLAALLLAQMGFRPLVLDRGTPVRQRTKDTWGLWRRSELQPESNVQFGEGGAGTFSDGKLWSGIKDSRHRTRKVLDEFVRAGAPPEITWVSKPHIGTFRLVTVVEAIRAEIERLGGTYRFGTKVDGLDLDAARRLRGLLLAGGGYLPATHAILAIGHSARDTFAMLDRHGVDMAAKPFSIGVRIEHPQALIDQRRFGPQAGHKLLGAADYKLVHHCSNGRTAYSFCMCPGGQVVAAASEPGHLVTNGMSQYSRAERNANAGLVVDVTPADYPGGPLAGIAFQRHWEALAYAAGGGGYIAPAQRLGDFMAGRPSTSLGSVVPSYRPGVRPTALDACLPDFAAAAIREAIPAFDRSIPGYALPDAVLTGVETRTSAPLRIARTPGCESPNTPGLFPAGEGAGYAGGILSAGVDGIKAAEAVALSITSAAAGAGERAA